MTATMMPQEFILPEPELGGGIPKAPGYTMDLVLILEVSHQVDTFRRESASATIWEDVRISFRLGLEKGFICHGNRASRRYTSPDLPK